MEAGNFFENIYTLRKWKIFSKKPKTFPNSPIKRDFFIKGFQKLYDFNDLYFTETNIPILSAQIEKNYQDYHSWFDSSFHKAGFELMFKDQWWNPFNTKLDERYFALVFHINELVIHASSFPSPDDTTLI